MLYEKDGTLVSTDNPNTIALQKCLQHLKLWKEENPTNVEDGIDYFGIFNRQVFLRSEVETIIEQHEQDFSSIEVGEIEDNTTTNVITLNLIFTFYDGESVNEQLELQVS